MSCISLRWSDEWIWRVKHFIRKWNHEDAHFQNQYRNLGRAAADA